MPYYPDNIYPVITFRMKGLGLRTEPFAKNVSDFPNPSPSKPSYNNGVGHTTAWFTKPISIC